SANSTDVKSSSGSNKRRRVELVDDDTAPVFPRDLSLHEVIGRYFKPLRDTEKIGMLQQALDLDNEEINKQRVMAFDDVKQCIEYLQTFIKNNTTHMKTYRVEVLRYFTIRTVSIAVLRFKSKSISMVLFSTAVATTFGFIITRVKWL